MTVDGRRLPSAAQIHTQVRQQQRTEKREKKTKRREVEVEDEDDGSGQIRGGGLVLVNTLSPRSRYLANSPLSGRKV
jgi:hypothetical protein